MTNNLAKSPWNQQTFGQFLYSLRPEKKILVCIQEKQKKKKLSVLLNETSIYIYIWLHDCI